MTNKISEKAIKYLNDEGILYNIVDNTIVVDMNFIKKGQQDDLISIMKTGTYPGEVKEKPPVDRFIYEHYYDRSFHRKWNEEVDGPWPYHEKSRFVTVQIDAWYEHELPKAVVVTKDTPEERLHDLIVIDDNDLPGWARSNNKAEVTHADAPTMNKVEE